MPTEKLSLLEFARQAGDAPRLSFKATRGEEGERLDVFVKRKIRWRSRREFQDLIRGGHILLNGEPRKPSTRLHNGDRVETPVPDPKKLPPREVIVPFDVLWEDEALLAVGKPPLIPTHPTRRHPLVNLLNALVWRYKDRGIKPQHLHRLDKETSGILLYAKDLTLVPALHRQFANRTVKKEYLAIVHGEVRRDEGTIEGGIARAVKSRIYMKREVSAKGHPSTTGFRVEERFKGFTLLRLFPKTGRCHQIRVHLAHIGHPVVGDKIYGREETFFLRYHRGMDPEEARRALLLPRQALHAARIIFVHPRDGKERDLTAPLPADLEEFLTHLRAGRRAGNDQDHLPGPSAKPSCRAKPV